MPRAMEMLKSVSDRRIQEKILARIESLQYDPEKQGKALTAELAGYRSLRAAGQRYRVIYRVDRRRVLVYVLAIGIRKEGDRQDVYALAQKLFKLRLLEP